MTLLAAWLDEDGFRNQIAAAAAVGDQAEWHFVRSVFADWLEDRGRYDEAEEVRERLSFPISPESDWPSVERIAECAPGYLSNHQLATLAKTLTQPIAILTGGPGTGKTRCSSAILQTLRRHQDLWSQGVEVCAPTGKAAVRVSEMCRALNLGIEAKTIHRTLEVIANGRDGDGWSFVHHERNQMRSKFFIVDESSMIDTDLGASLLRACRTGAHILFVGDTGQLPPVGHGCPLRDMGAAGIPLGRLTEIHRNAGMIPRACAAIAAGEPIPTVDNWRGQDANVVLRNSSNIEETHNLLRSLLTALRDKGTYDVVNDIQVLCPLNEAPLGRSALNPLVQSVLNPDGEPCGENGIYRIGDKVMCLRNQMNGLHYFVNGEIGRVVEGGKNGCLATFSENRFVTIPYKGEAARDWTPAWAITGHKSQGSEWPIVIAPIDESWGARRVTGREWWYTVISRARDVFFGLGSKSALARQARAAKLARRRTLLTELLLGIAS